MNELCMKMWIQEQYRMSQSKMKRAILKLLDVQVQWRGWTRHDSEEQDVEGSESSSPNAARPEITGICRLFRVGHAANHRPHAPSRPNTTLTRSRQVKPLAFSNIDIEICYRRFKVGKREITAPTSATCSLSRADLLEVPL